MIGSVFTKKELSGYALLYLTDLKCPVCDVFLPLIDEASARCPVLVVKKVDKQSAPQLAGQLLVFQFPTAIVFYQGKEMKRFVGAYAFEGFQSIMADLIEK